MSSLTSTSPSAGVAPSSWRSHHAPRAASAPAGVPCAHTRTIGFQTTKSSFEELQKQEAKNGKRNTNYALYAVGGAAGLVVLAGLGVGAALVFGDLGATLANSGIGDVLGGAGDGLGELLGGDACCALCTGGCDACGECGDCECGDCVIS